jgi:hypothetical protein
MWAAAREKQEHRLRLPMRDPAKRQRRTHPRVRRRDAEPEPSPVSAGVTEVGSQPECREPKANLATGFATGRSGTRYNGTEWNVTLTVIYAYKTKAYDI